MKGFTSLLLHTVILLGCGFFLLSGCIGSVAPLYEYTLSPMVQQDESSRSAQAQSLMLMPVLVPSWSTDSGIVTRSSSNSINTSATHLWAGTLQNQLAITLAENIRRLGGIKDVQIYPGPRFAKPVLLLELEFLRFDGELGNSFTCSAIWTISDNKQKKTILRREFSTTVAVERQGYRSYVKAASTAIFQLSRKIDLSLQQIRRTP